MKSLARLHVWWPSIDTDIESFVKSCVNCAKSAKEPTKVPLRLEILGQESVGSPVQS